MKVGPDRNYLVRVLRAEWEEETLRPELYRDIFQVTLHTIVNIAFIPDVSAVAPPWDAGLLPADLDDISTAEEARLVCALFTSYVVTPNAGRAGTVERVTSPSPRNRADPVIVRYVAPAEFGRYLADLDRLNHVVGSVIQATVRVGDLRGYEVIQFIEREVVPAPWLRPSHARMLGRSLFS